MRQSLKSKQIVSVNNNLTQEDLQNAGGAIKFTVQTSSQLSSLDPQIGDIAYIATDKVMAIYNGQAWVVLAGYSVDSIYDFNLETISTPAYNFYEEAYVSDFPTPTEGINFGYASFTDSYYLWNGTEWRQIIREEYDYQTCLGNYFGIQNFITLKDSSYLFDGNRLFQLSPLVLAVSPAANLDEPKDSFATISNTKINPYYYLGYLDTFWGDSIPLFNYNEVACTVYEEKTNGVVFGLEVTHVSSNIVNISSGSAYVYINELVNYTSQQVTLNLSSVALIELTPNGLISVKYTLSNTFGYIQLAKVTLDGSGVILIEDLRRTKFILNGLKILKVGDFDYLLEAGRAYINGTLAESDFYPFTVDTSTVHGSNFYELIQIKSDGTINHKVGASQPSEDSDKLKLGTIYSSHILSDASVLYLSNANTVTNLISKLPLMVEVGSDKYYSTTLNYFRPLTSTTVATFNDLPRYGTDSEEDKVYYVTDIDCYFVRYLEFLTTKLTDTYYFIDEYIVDFDQESDRKYYTYKQLNLVSNENYLVHENAASVNLKIQNKLKWRPYIYHNKDNEQDLLYINDFEAKVGSEFYSKHTSKYGVVSGLNQSVLGAFSFKINDGIAWVKNNSITRFSEQTFSITAPTTYRYDLFELNQDGTITVSRSTDSTDAVIPTYDIRRIPIAYAEVSPTIAVVHDLRPSETSYQGWFKHGIRIVEVNDVNECFNQTGLIAKVGSSYYVRATSTWESVGGTPTLNQYVGSLYELQGSNGSVGFIKSLNKFYIITPTGNYEIIYNYPGNNTDFITPDTEYIYFRDYGWSEDTSDFTYYNITDGNITTLGEVIFENTGLSRTHIEVSSLPSNSNKENFIAKLTTNNTWWSCVRSSSVHIIWSQITPTTIATYQALMNLDVQPGDYGLVGTTVYKKGYGYQNWSIMTLGTDEGQLTKVGSNYFIKQCGELVQITLRYTAASLTLLKANEITNGTWYYVTDRSCLYYKNNYWVSRSKYTVSSMSDLSDGQTRDLVYVSGIKKYLSYTDKSFKEVPYNQDTFGAIETNNPRYYLFGDNYKLIGPGNKEDYDASYSRSWVF